jgi:hypothetical protein
LRMILSFLQPLAGTLHSPNLNLCTSCRHYVHFQKLNICTSLYMIYHFSSTWHESCTSRNLIFCTFWYYCIYFPLE